MRRNQDLFVARMSEVLHELRRAHTVGDNAAYRSLDA
jgi:hypothetical protein